MKFNHIISVVWIFTVMSCKTSSKVESESNSSKLDKTNILQEELETSKFAKKDLNSKEKIKHFFNQKKQSSIKDVKKILWIAQSEFTRSDITSLWYIFEAPSFERLESEDMILNGFTLRFKNNKLVDYGLDYR